MRIRTTMILFVLLLIPAARPQAAPAQSPAASDTARELSAMLNQFLQDAAHNNAAGFDAFFADDVIYTHSTGALSTKAEIMKSVSSARPATPSSATFSAEDVTVHEYGDTAVVAFRLVSRTDRGAGSPPTIASYRNTGTFLKRNGRWQVVAWQSTKIPDNNAAR
jgi:ketosteroid isomerase-like protein